VNLPLTYEAPFAVIGRIDLVPAATLGHGASFDRFQLVGTASTREGAETMARNWVIQAAPHESRVAKIMRSLLTINLTRDVKETPDAEA
jgi:hypothetical protein